MYTEVRNITVDEFNALCLVEWPSDAAYRSVLTSFAERSDPLLGFFWKNKLIGLLGAIPGGVLSGSAYLWAQETAATHVHPALVARVSKATINELLKRYPRLIGHCEIDSHAVKWMKFLGAKFHRSINTAVEFEIGVLA